MEMILYENESIVINAVGLGILIMAVGIIVNIIFLLLSFDVNIITLVIIVIGYGIAMLGIMNPCD